MKKIIVASLFAIILLTSPGCAWFCNRDDETQVSIESYKKALTKVRSNLKDSIRPALDKALPEKTEADKAVKKGKLALVDDTIALVDDTLTGAKAGVKPEGESE